MSRTPWWIQDGCTNAKLSAELFVTNLFDRSHSFAVYADGSHALRYIARPVDTRRTSSRRSRARSDSRWPLRSEAGQARPRAATEEGSGCTREGVPGAAPRRTPLVCACGDTTHRPPSEGRLVERNTAVE